MSVSLVQQKLKSLFEELVASPDVQVVAVTKYATLSQMIEAFEYGIRSFGENKIQDAEKKNGSSALGYH